MNRRFWIAAIALAACTDNFGKFQFTDGGIGGGGGDGGLDLAAAGDLASAPDLLGCPAIFGKYSVQQQGDCGDLNDNAPECAAMTTNACFVHFSSAPSGATPAVNGAVTINSAGQFVGSLILGTVTRTNCMGMFNPGNNTLTIVCDAGKSNECDLTLTRTSLQCG